VQNLEEHSRAPQHHPQAMLPDVESEILRLRTQHPPWGSPKLRAFLEREAPELVLPATSSMGDLLRREGLAHPRRKRLRWPDLRRRGSRIRRFRRPS
jgi:putative transposase